MSTISIVNSKPSQPVRINHKQVKHNNKTTPNRSGRDTLVIRSKQADTTPTPSSNEKPVHIRDIFKLDKHGTLEYVLRPKGRDTIFKIDRSKYPQVLSNEQVATGNQNAGKLIIRDGFHQIVFSAPVIKDETGPVWVRLGGPVIWPIDSPKKDTKSKQEASTMPAKPGEAWQQILQQIFKEARAPQKPREPFTMKLNVRFSDLSPEGFTDQLELIPTDSLPQLWAQVRPDIEE